MNHDWWRRGVIYQIYPRSFRDANADDLSDCLDFVNPPAFLDPPVLPAPALPEARQVANSNRIQVAARVDNRTNRLMLFSSLDNLGKGNASQAIQAANLAFGLGETLGLA